MVYSVSYKMLEDNIKSGYQVSLAHDINLLDMQIRQINSTSKNIGIDPSILTLYNTQKLDDGIDRYYEFYEASQQLKYYTVGNPLIKKCFLSLPDRDITITPYGIYDTKVYMKIIDDDLAEYATKNIKTFQTNNEQVFKKKILNVNSIPIGNRSRVAGSINITMDKKALQKFISPIQYQHEAFFIAIDKKGNNIMQLKGRACGVDLQNFILEQWINEMGPGDYMINTVTSQYNGWKYYSFVPMKQAFKRLNFFSTIVMVLLGIICIMGSGLSFYFAKYHTKPIKEMLGMLKNNFSNEKEDEEKVNAYMYIHQSLEELIKDKNMLANQLQKQKPIIQMDFVRNLLEGKLYKSKEIEAYTELIDHGQLEQSLRVIIIEFINDFIDANKEELTAIHISKSVIKKEINALLGNGYYIYDLSNRRIALITNACKEHLLRKKLQQLVHILSIKNIHVTMGVGKGVKELSLVYQSYHQGLEAVEYNKFNSQRYITYYEDISVLTSNDFYYPLELELQLMDTLKSGNKQRLKEILKEVFEENFERRHLTLEKRKQLVYLMRGTIMRQLVGLNYEGNHELEHLIKCMNTSDSADYIFNCVIRIHNIIVEHISNENEKEKIVMKQKIINYIDQHFIDGDLTLYTLAQQFHYSEAYMYQFFKQNMDCTYSSYLENLRLKKACSLLSTTDLTINIIGKQVGYNNDTTFRRAFKRVKGVTPSSYRQTLKKKG